MTSNIEDARSSILWVDGVGGFLLIDRDEVILGQAIASSSIDIGIVGDLSRQAAVVRRVGGDYLLQPLQATRLNERTIDRAQLLTDNDRIELGRHVKLSFRKPHPLSATAKLELTSLSRFKPSVDAVLLMADSCVIGPALSSHILCSQWNNELLMVKRPNGWCFNTQEELEVNGTLHRGLIPIRPGLRVCGTDFSLSIE